MAGSGHRSQAAQRLRAQKERCGQQALELGVPRLQEKEGFARRK